MGKNDYFNKIDSLNYYSATKKYDLRFSSLQEDLVADVVVIGGGFTGVNTALELAEKGIKNIVIIEAKHLGYGGTGRNGGHIMPGVGHNLDLIKKDIGEAGVEAIFKVSAEGIKIVKERIKRYGIDADFRHGYGFCAFNPRQQKLLASWEKEFKALDPNSDIGLVTGSEVKSVVGSDSYCSVLRYMDGGHVHSLNLLLGEASAATDLGVKIYENSKVISVEYGEKIKVRTSMGSVVADKMLWACDSFINGLEPELEKSIINTMSFQMATEPLSDEMINRISPIRGAFSDVRPVIDYYRVTNENRLLFGGATHLVEYTPKDLFHWNRNIMLNIFPYLKDVKIDMAWGGPMSLGRNLFPQVGTIAGHSNVFYVQGYAGFGVTPSHLVSRIVAEGILGGGDLYNLFTGIHHKNIFGRESLKNILLTGGKAAHQLQGYFTGQR